MKLFRYFLAIFILLIGLAFLCGAYWLARYANSEQTRHLRGDEKQLVHNAMQHVNSFVKRNERLPTNEEYEAWRKDMSKEIHEYEGRGFTLSKAPFAPEIVDAFGKPPPNAFIVTFWNGRVWVQCASWYAKDDYGYVSNSDYYIFGSKLVDLSVLMFFGLTSFWVSFRLIKKSV